MRRTLAFSAACVVLVACGAVAPPDAGLPIEDVQMSGRALPGNLADNPTGPHVELFTGTVEGRDVEIVAQLDGDGVCMAIRRAPDGHTSCGPLPQDGALGEGFGMVMAGGSPVADDAPPVPLEVAGMITADVAEVVAEFDDGREARAVLFSLEPAQVEGRGFVVYVPADVPSHSLVALAADGTEIGRLGFHPAP